MSQTRRLMGTTVTVTVLHEPADAARRAVAAAFAEMARVEALLSAYRETSEIGRLNRDGRVAAGPELRSLIERSCELHAATEGAFDITVQPLLDLYGASFAERGVPPSDEEIAAALDRVDAGRIRMEEEEIVLPPGVNVTLGGIAKGYAVDRAAAVLAERGVTSALVEAGGDMRALGDKSGRPWRIALRDPRDRGGMVTVISLEDRALATSGDYERFFEPTKEYHHIIDPRTGRSAVDAASVTVLAGSCLEADALATAIFVLGKDRGVELARALPGVEALVIARQGEAAATSGLAEHLP